MTGTWVGYYRFDNANSQKAMGFEKTFFTITILSVNGNCFEGIVNDDVKTGGMEGSGEIFGEIKGGNIYFKKLMPKAALLYPNGELRYTDNKHPAIYYSGIISEDKKEATGVWKFKYKVGYIFGFIPFPYRPGKGTWSMSLQ